MQYFKTRLCSKHWYQSMLHLTLYKRYLLILFIRLYFFKTTYSTSILNLLFMYLNHVHCLLNSVEQQGISSVENTNAMLRSKISNKCLLNSLNPMNEYSPPIRGFNMPFQRHSRILEGLIIFILYVFFPQY